MKNSQTSPACYDLHLHTYWSYDATAEPEPYFQRARELGVRCLAITEHHHCDSLDEVRLVAERYPEVRVIPAAELTVTTSLGAVDLLCYNLPRLPEPPLSRVLEDYQAWQHRAGAARIEGMQALGFSYGAGEQFEMLQSYRPAHVLARHGVTHASTAAERKYFVNKGFLAREEDYPTFLRSLSEKAKRPGYPPVESVVPAVKAAGGLVVIAHPSKYFRGHDLGRMDALREECQLDGIECAHRTTSPELTEAYRAYCRVHQLVSTAGSDCHNPGDVLSPPAKWGYTEQRRFACHLGEASWLEELLERIPHN